MKVKYEPRRHAKDGINEVLKENSISVVASVYDILNLLVKIWNSALR